jgi:hypothetical protein
MRYKWEPMVRATGQARHGAMRALFGGIRAPSTLGSFLRGNVLLGCSPKAARTAGAFFSVTVPMNPHVAAAIQPIRAAVVSTVTLRRFRS